MAGLLRPGTFKAARLRLRTETDLINKEIDSLQSSVNPVGIAHLGGELRARLFRAPSRRPDPRLIIASKTHLRNQGLLGKKTKPPTPIDYDLPHLLGQTLDEHFQKIGRHMCSPYLHECLKFVKRDIPQRPEKFIVKSGWVRYAPNAGPEPVGYPRESVIVFDTEVLYKIHDFAVIATAASTFAWYVWISPWLLGETANCRQLILLGNHTQSVIGHNVSYDRKRVKEEYSLAQSKKFFMDTMSLHVATHGMCSRQRPTWMSVNKYKKESTEDLFNEELRRDPWISHSALNSLADVVKYNLHEEMDKSARDYFGELSREQTVEKLPELIRYCCTDVYYTKLVFDKVFPEFLRVCPHPVSFGALRPMSSVFLPINSTWKKYIETAETVYNSINRGITEKLVALADKCAQYVKDPEKLEKAKADPWLGQLDWSVKPLRMTKTTAKQPARPMKNQKLAGYPKWYRDLFPSAKKPMLLSTRTRVTPLLLRLRWDGHPLFWVNAFGWCFLAPIETKKHYTEMNYFNVEDRGDKTLFKLPHTNGADARCSNPFGKSYIPYFEKGLLTSDNEDALHAINSNALCSYWTSVRERIAHQMPVYQSDTDMGFDSNDQGIIIPQIVTMGTVSRRAVENTWLTASNAKANRLGSELKAMIKAPPGYVFVGADVDSEELWIASLFGDAVFGMHGGSALGWMTLEGTKKEGTDLHSRTAQILGISRNEAKIFNYGRIYGAGLNFAIRLLKQFNPQLTDEEAEKAATRLYKSTKGQKRKSQHRFLANEYWAGGSESVVFNQLESLATYRNHRTPVLGAGITEALSQKHLKVNSFLTSRVNWSIQSSGVDYLHLLLAAMHYLIEVYGLKARLAITIHDEVRYLAEESDMHRVALALQTANLWTRAMFCQQVGIEDVPESVAFFSLVDLDKVLRKEVDENCVTPSNPEPLSPGTALDIKQLTEKCNSLGPPNMAKIKEFMQMPFEERRPVLRELPVEPNLHEYVQAQLFD